MFRPIAPVLLLAAVGCGGPAWEESHRVQLDGSGESVVRIAPDRLPGAGGLEDLLSGPGLEVEPVGTLGDGRVEGRVAFASLEALCGAPLFERDCAYRPEGTGFSMRMTVPGPADGQAMRIEMRPEARITSHNSEGPIQRGNRLRWRLDGTSTDGDGRALLVTTDAASVLSATVGTVLRAGAIAAGTVVIGLLLLVLEGRRRLAAEARQPARADAAPGTRRRDQSPATRRKSPG